MLSMQGAARYCGRRWRQVLLVARPGSPSGQAPTHRHMLLPALLWALLQRIALGRWDHLTVRKHRALPEWGSGCAALAPPSGTHCRPPCGLRQRLDFSEVTLLSDYFLFLQLLSGFSQEHPLQKSLAQEPKIAVTRTPCVAAPTTHTLMSGLPVFSTQRLKGVWELT